MSLKSKTVELSGSAEEIETQIHRLREIDRSAEMSSGSSNRQGLNSFVVFLVFGGVWMLFAALYQTGSKPFFVNAAMVVSLLVAVVSLGLAIYGGAKSKYIADRYDIDNSRYETLNDVHNGICALAGAPSEFLYRLCLMDYCNSQFRTKKKTEGVGKNQVVESDFECPVIDGECTLGKGSRLHFKMTRLVHQTAWKAEERRNDRTVHVWRYKFSYRDRCEIRLSDPAGLSVRIPKPGKDAEGVRFSMADGHLIASYQSEGKAPLLPQGFLKLLSRVSDLIPG